MIPDLFEQLKTLTGSVCLIGIGDVDYGDAGFGVRLAEELLAAEVPGVIVAGTAPERCIGFVDGVFQHLLFLGSIALAAIPGSAVLLDSRQIAARFPRSPTEENSLGGLAQWIEAHKKIKVWFLGVQPESLELGRQLSRTVQATLETLTDSLCGLMLSRKTKGTDTKAVVAHA